MKSLGRIVTSFMLPLACLPLFAAPHATCDELASRVLASIKSENYPAAVGDFSEEMKAALPAEKLHAVMQQIAAKYGKIERLESASPAAQGQDTAATVAIYFSGGALDARLACSADGKVTGLHFVPHKGPSSGATSYRKPGYAAGASFDEVQTAIGPHRLPAIVTVPKARALVPAVVFVHGSGPLDMDESIGPNKPFLDLALGLAAKGIASLRYDKRTFAHPELFARAGYTLDDEVVEDAVAAVAELRRTPGIDPDRVFLLGHSLGARLLPFIARRAPVRGLILLAAPAAPFADVLKRQAEYVATAGGHVPSDDERHALERFEREIDHLRELLAGKVPEGPLPLGLPPAYAKELAADDPIEASSALHIPELVLQGARDYQVTVADDFSLWQARFARDSRFTLRTYPNLNHLFEDASGPDGPAQYQHGGNVSAEVIQDVSAWIASNLA